ncbi:MAG: hypothetical protein DI533_12430 [Cereibacter sphaeroides]|uniref:Uncharacterized protein n=1 Tax=Cereibacter sphaeroides TaxID=1063 RepID=A0A2W5S4J4_CERSP|nr:MAG: hypothetical protein DI533_12430 [Cereibacter sphaeroides]
MLVKSVFLFLLGMVAVAMIGRAIFPSAFRRKTRLLGGSDRPNTCPRCGNFIIGKGPCGCSGAQRKARS